jgi:pectate lyase
MSQIKHVLFFTSIVVDQIIALFRCDFFHKSMFPETKENGDETKQTSYTSSFITLTYLKFGTHTKSRLQTTAFSDPVQVQIFFFRNGVRW